MAHLLAAKYAPPASAQTQAKTANALFIVSIPITFDSTDGVETWRERGKRYGAKIKFKKAIASGKNVTQRCCCRN
jgi:hypothetical protein